MSEAARVAAGLAQLAQINHWPEDLSDPQFYRDRLHGVEFWVLRYSDDGRDRFYLVMSGRASDRAAVVAAFEEILGPANFGEGTAIHTFIPREWVEIGFPSVFGVAEWSTYQLDRYLRQAGLGHLASNY